MKVILAATDQASAPVQPSDFPHAAFSLGDRRITSALTEFDGSRERFAPPALRVLDEFGTAFAADPHGAGLEALMTAVLTHLDVEIAILARDVATTALRGHAGNAAERPSELFDDTSGRLRSEFSTWLALERACTHAETERLVRLQLSPAVGLARVTAAIANGLRRSHRPRGDLLSADHGFAQLVTRVDVREPDREAALDVARDCATGLAARVGVPEVVSVVSRLSGVPRNQVIRGKPRLAEEGPVRPSPFHVLALPVDATTEEVVERSHERAEFATSDEERHLVVEAQRELITNPVTRLSHQLREVPGTAYRDQQRRTFEHRNRRTPVDRAALTDPPVCPTRGEPPFEVPDVVFG